MQQYDSYKPSGVKWIGEIPSHWKVERLKINCTLKGRVGWKGLSSNEFKDTSYAYLVTGQDFDGSVIQWNKCYEIDKWRYDEDPFIQLQNGDLLVTKDGTIGKIAKVSDLDKPACLNSGIFVLKQRDNQFCQDYLYWTLVSSQLKDFTDYNSGGQTTIQHLYQNVFEDMPLIIPPLEEQERIAEYLERRCAEIDGIITKEEQAITLLDELKQTLISEAVTRGLDPTVPLKPSGVDWIGNIPSHWQVSRLKNTACLFGRIGYRGYTVADLVNQGEGVITLSPSNMVNGSMDYTSCSYLSWKKYYESPEIMIKNGDILLVKTGSTYGKTSYVSDLPMEATINPQIVVFKSIAGNSKFLFYLLTTHFLQHQIKRGVGGSTIPTLSEGFILNCMHPLPPLEEQERIAEYLDKRCAEIDEAKERKQRQIELLREMKQIMISDTVTGRVKVF